MAIEMKFTTDRIKRLYDRLQSDRNYIDIERAKYFTESFKETEGEPINVRFAKALLHTAQNITVRIEDDQLLAGQVGGPERYGILYPELDGLFFSDLKRVLSDRQEATFNLREEDRKYLIDVVAPYWQGKTYYEELASSLPQDLLRLTYNPENIKESRYLINETATMNSATQWVHDYKIGIDRGFEAIKRHAEQRLKELENETEETIPDIEVRRAFEQSSIIVSDAIITFAERYGYEAYRLAETELDDDRKRELKELGRILHRVPRYPAESFYEAFRKQEEYLISKTCEQIWAIHKAREGHFASPLGSVLHGLCLEKERDIHSSYIEGGINLGFFDMVGFATTIDSLAAVKKNVYEENNVSLGELVKALDANFDGYETLRQRLIHSAAYGNNDHVADEIGKDIDRLASKVAAREADRLSGGRLVIDVRYVPASANVAMGKVLSALPDGRLQGLPVSDGTSAAQGADEHGPTAVLLSNFKSKNLDLNNRAARLLNLKFSPASVAGREGTRRLVDFIKSWRDLKLWHVQFNIIDQATLIDAKEHPENYRNLIVRVAGYSAYFVNLSAELQQDIINRTNHETVA